MGSSLARIEFLADSTFFNRKVQCCIHLVKKDILESKKEGLKTNSIESLISKSHYIIIKCD